jgi:hypothetical protein
MQSSFFEAMILFEVIKYLALSFCTMLVESQCYIPLGD